ncbi:sensor histidine kinase [Nonomuraea rubra]|uniref:histidine kinase n=2 Tax=Nonomuraea rubra TaxID=46180 RepID=A0A7X0P0R3_9ACTN|nr:ATP-binding protein [Nonomuraea rubra]MBB6553128.1 signal transduction histidine kinase [Nonomuraea rubra]
MRGGQSLAEALESYLAEWSERTGITVETWALPATDVPSRVSSGVMTTMREALSNVELHSRARTVSIAVTVGKSGLRMTVSDNGQGFPTSGAGRGIARMRAAFAELGGTLSVNSVHGEGTTVTGVVPRRR